MHYSTLLQGSEFLYCVCGGIVIGLVYALFGIFRFHARKSRHAIFMYICDAAFYACAAVISFITLYIANDCSVRLYLLVGLLFGALISAGTFRLVIRH